MRDNGLTHQKRTSKVDPNNTLPFFQGRFLKRFAQNHACVVVQDIDPTEGCDGFFDDSVNLILVCGVGLDKFDSRIG